jgi:hypothetical protein
MRWDECRFENRDKSRNRNKDKDWNKCRDEDWIEREIKQIDDDRFREKTLIRNVEVREIKSINKRIDLIWLKRNVFIYKQRVFLFETCRFEIQRNQKFDRVFMNFCFFDSDDLNSNNLSSFREFDDSFARSALRVRECEIIAWKYDD